MVLFPLVDGASPASLWELCWGRRQHVSIQLLQGFPQMVSCCYNDMMVTLSCRALQPPHYKSSWYCGIRVIGSNKLVGFISGVPAVVSVKGQWVDHMTLSCDMFLLSPRVKTMAEINFLCVHKKLRSKRMAPVLIREITRRVNLENIFQALYTAGVKLPTPIASCRWVWLYLYIVNTIKWLDKDLWITGHHYSVKLLSK